MRTSAGPITGTRRVVPVSFITQIVETAAFVAAAILTTSSALVAQSFAAGANIAVEMFLFIGVHASTRDADDSEHQTASRNHQKRALEALLA